jgi:cation diffusion facilitator family transporter
MKTSLTPSERSIMSREKNRVALISVFAAVLLTSLKLVVGVWTGSLGILSEAAHSGFDLLAAGITLVAVRIADRPPDKDHQYGHGKVENLSALIETLLLLITCVWILYEAYHRLMTGRQDIDVNVYSFAVIGTSIVIDFWRSRALSKVARKYHSQALEADALHFQTDIYSSAVVIVGLICVTFGFPAGDAIAAILVACIVIWISIQLGRRTINVLLDRAPHGLDEQVTALIAGVDGVEKIHSLRVRESGAHVFIDVVVAIHRLATFDQAHRIMDAVEQTVLNAMPRTDIFVHAEPVIGPDERVSDSINWLVQQSGLTPHNIIILETDDSYHIQLDIEYPQGTTFEQAHAQASVVEKNILRELPGVSEVHVHLEEESAEAINAQRITDEESRLVEDIRSSVTGQDHVQECRTIQCYQSKRGLKISVQCGIDSRLTLKDAHTVVSKIETSISRLDGRIIKVFVHAEPSA